MFKPYQISNSAQQEIRTQKSDFLDAVREQLSRLGPSSSSNPVVPDTPQSVNQNVSVLDKVSGSQSEDSEFQKKNLQKLLNFIGLIVSLFDQDIQKPNIQNSK